MDFTPAQKSAMSLKGRTLLVSAAAGSGKTFTLTKRIINSIIEDGQDLSRLIIVTFTRAAAGELRAKISKALSEAIAEHPDNTHLQKQLLKLGSAHISTIDSFFNEPVRANFEKLGLPAGMRLADDAELAPLKESSMKAVLDSFFDECENYRNGELSEIGYQSLYTQLIGVISNSRNSSTVIPVLLDMYKKLITAPESIRQLKKHADRMRENAKKDFLETEEGSIIYDTVKKVIENSISELEQCILNMQDDEFVKGKYLVCFEENLSLCTALLQKVKHADYSELCGALAGFEVSKIPSIKAVEKTELSERCQNARKKKINDPIKNLATKYFYMTGEQISACFEKNAAFCELLYNILQKFDTDYSEEKLRRGICEFSDMPKFMLKLLLDEDGAPSEYARSMFESFDEIYIDEYQDVNEIQDRIFELIGQSHRYMVGDIKQSIYGFREAEPSIFANYRKLFPVYNEERDEIKNGGSTILMSNNFRCDENVVDFTNIVCSSVFSAFSDIIGYTHDDDLVFSKNIDNEEYKSPKVVLNLIQSAKSPKSSEDEDDSGLYEDSTDMSDEAIVVANEIADLIRNQKKADGSSIRGSDIAVIVRGLKGALPLTDALKALNIKYVLSSSKEIFESEDTKLLTDLLSVIDNPRIDIPLYRLITAQTELAEPVFSLEEVVHIRKHTETSKSLFDAIIKYGEDNVHPEISARCREFVAMIEKMRAVANKLSADKLIKSLSLCPRYARLADTRAYAYIYDLACKYVKNVWSSLYSFLKYFKSLMEKGEGGAESASVDPNAVNIMTIHHSKGLEYTACFLFDCNRLFNFRDASKALIFTKKFGISMKFPVQSSSEDSLVNKISQRYSSTPLWNAATIELNSKTVEEESRNLYVALTRARERLYISATLNKDIEAYMELLRDESITQYKIKHAKNYIDWILPALAHDTEKKDAYEIKVFSEGDASLTSPLGASEKALSTIQLDDDEKELSMLLNSPSNQDENEKILSTIPSKVAASKVSPHMLDDSVFIPVPTGILFSESDEDKDSQSSDNEKRLRHRIELMRSATASFDSLLDVNKKPTAAEIGTATHLFLQYCDYQNVEKNGVEAEISRLREMRFITERVAGIINRDQLSGFFKSSMYAHVLSAKNVLREFKFGLFKSASNFTQNETLKDLVGDKKIFVQGSIDLLIETADGDILLCDYKTDRITHEEMRDRALLIRNMRERHGEQLEQYKYAVNQIFGKTPKSIYIYSLPLGEAIEM